MKKIVIVFVCMIAVASCKNDNTLEEDTDTYTPLITFIEPAESEVFTSGDEIHMEVDFEYPGNIIHHVGLNVIDEATGDTVYTYEEHSDANDFYNLHEHYVTSVTSSTEYMVEAWSSNHDESIKVAEHVHVTVNP